MIQLKVSLQELPRWREQSNCVDWIAQRLTWLIFVLTILGFKKLVAPGPSCSWYVGPPRSKTQSSSDMQVLINLPFCAVFTAAGCTLLVGGMAALAWNPWNALIPTQTNGAYALRCQSGEGVLALRRTTRFCMQWEATTHLLLATVLGFLIV